MKSRPLTDVFVSNGCSSSASAGNLPKFQGGSGNTLSTFLTEKFQGIESEFANIPKRTQQDSLVRV